jgi:hypothetical protein
MMRGVERGKGTRSDDPRKLPQQRYGVKEFNPLQPNIALVLIL